MLRLSNLVEGMYKFRLTVADGKGLKGNDHVVLTVKEGTRLISILLHDKGLIDLHERESAFFPMQIYNFLLSRQNVTLTKGFLGAFLNKRLLAVESGTTKF